MKKPWLAVAVVLLAVSAMVAYRTFVSAPASSRPQEPSAVAAYVAAEGKVEAMPGFDADVGTGELNGKVGKILVKEGEQVKEGQVIATLQNADLEARVKAAEQSLAVARSRLWEVESGARREEVMQAAAMLEGTVATLVEARQQYWRYRELRKQGMVSQAALDTKEGMLKAAEAGVKEAQERKKLLVSGPKPETVRLYSEQVKLAQAELEYSRKLLDRTLIRAPISGTVIQRHVDEGEGITPEIPLLTVADLDKVWINAEVDETDVGRIKEGNRVEIASEAFRGKLFKGEIQQIADYVGNRKVRPSNPATNLGMKVVQVKIRLLEPTPLKLGMSVDVKIFPAGK